MAHEFYSPCRLLKSTVLVNVNDRPFLSKALIYMCKESRELTHNNDHVIGILVCLIWTTFLTVTVYIYIYIYIYIYMNGKVLSVDQRDKRSQTSL